MRLEACHSSDTDGCYHPCEVDREPLITAAEGGQR